MKTLIRTCAFLGVLSFGIFLVISVLLARWAVRPVERAWNQQRQFVADASHELKTPLTVILTNSELLASGEYSREESVRFLNSIQAMAIQMRGLVEGLLELARVDNGTAQMVFTRLNLSEQAQNTALVFEPVYFENELILETDIVADIMIQGSLTHINQLLEILLDNGAKYASRDAKLSLRQQGNHALLTVATSGDAISREDLKRIFKRFYRIDKVRSMNHSYGLGLSIAESIVREHHGKIWAESENGVNTFFVQLPVV